MSNDFLGKGWAFPPQLEAEGGVATSSYKDNIEESIKIILNTAKGERQMRPDFGCGIHQLVFAKNNTATAGMAEYHVEEALIKWEPRIEVLNVTAYPDRSSENESFEGNKLIVEIDYRIIATNSIFNLVYPFYLTEGIGV